MQTLLWLGANGTGEHKHRLIDFRLTNITFSNRLAMINGTASLMTSGNEPPGLPTLMMNIPVTTKIENLRTISINIDKKISDHHFGESPIFGSVTSRSSE